MVEGGLLLTRDCNNRAPLPHTWPIRKPDKASTKSASSCRRTVSKITALNPAWETAGFKAVILETVRRQDEADFVLALSGFRMGHVWGNGARLLQSRVRSNPPSTMPRLFTHNVQVDKWNTFQLSELPGEESVLEAEQTEPEHQREFLTKNLLTPATLRLKPGAMVMFTVNKNRNASGGHHTEFVNGQMGVVE